MAHAVTPLFTQGVPGARDVLSLVNTNSMMTSLGIELFGQVERLWSASVLCTAKASSAAGFGSRHFEEKGLGPASTSENPEVAEVGRLLRAAVAEYDLGFAPNQEVQARYSIRCAPMVLGATLWSLRRAEERLLWEARRVADNPLVLEDGFFHGAHFYAIGIAQAVDCLSDVCGRLCEMLDRQVLTLMDPKLSGLPRNLENEKDHCKGLSQLISALYQRLRGMMVPSRALSFSCEGNNQDIVPCGMSALLSLSDQLEVAGHVFRATQFCMDRALYLKAGKALPPELQLEGWRGELGH
jgi:histidine ammonia-lyase